MYKIYSASMKERIQEIVGGSLEDPAWLAKLYVAIRLRKDSL
jgi:DNA-binding PucR family transcriptional regulator